MIERLCGRVAGAALLAVAGLLLLDVLGRAAGHPLFGAQDLAEMAMMVIVFGAVPLLQRPDAEGRDAQIRVDLLSWIMPPALRRGVDRLSSMLAALIWAALCWTLCDAAALSSLLSLSSNILGLPRAGFQYLMAGFVALAGIGAMVRAVSPMGAKNG
ncbi:MAG TPA: TRAP transporter small permease subunit [Paenirhodobacter sp.]